MKLCPACSEEIQDNAKKCKHCGEWMNAEPKVSINPSADDGSAMARAISKGIKQKEWHDFALGMRAFGALIISIIIGVVLQAWYIGVAAFLIMGLFIRRKYYKE